MTPANAIALAKEAGLSNMISERLVRDWDANLLAFANLIEARVLADEYVSVSLSRDGVVTTHNPFDADFDEMVRATEAIVKALQERLSNRKFCPYSHGSALKNAAIRSTDADHIAGDGK